MGEVQLTATAIQKLNEELGNDIANLDTCGELMRKLQEQKDKIEKSFSVTGSDVPSKISTTIKEVEEASNNVRVLSKQHSDLNSSVKKYQKKVDHVKVKTEEYLNKIKLLETTCDYLRLAKEIEDTSNSIEAAIHDKNERKQVMNFTVLCDVWKIMRTTKCVHLLQFIHDTMHYWHNILKDRYTADYDEVLKVIKWPFVGDHILHPPTTETMNQFQIISEHLLQIQLEPEIPREDAPPLSLPLLLLIRPLRKRFLYHFSGSRQTNRPDKPEWFLTQVSTWIRDHKGFIESNLQPVYDRLGRRGVSAKVELMRGLVEMVIEKLHRELLDLQYDDSLFAHAVDEAIGFDKELKECFGYPASQSGVMQVLTQARVFDKWLHMERRYSSEKMEKILNSDTAFESSGGSDETQVTECAASFLTLLSTITDRYQGLAQPGHRLRFLELQLYLITDLRVRLLQLTREDPPNPLNSHFPNVLNTLSYVRSVLEEWGTNTHFLHLHYYRSKLVSVETQTPVTEGGGTVFDESIAWLRSSEKELLDRLLDFVSMEVKARSLDYRREKWHAMDPPPPVLPTLTPSSSSIFHSLTSSLHSLQTSLSPSLCRTSLSLLAAQLDTYLFEEIAALAHFNPGGARQFDYDINKGLVSLFKQYVKPNQTPPSFKLLRDSCLVLTLPRGSALLLRETLRGREEGSWDSREVLNDMGVFKLDKPQVLRMLERRTDLIQ